MLFNISYRKGTPVYTFLVSRCTVRTNLTPAKKLNATVFYKYEINRTSRGDGIVKR
jgi:hypothetical protein